MTMTAISGTQSGGTSTASTTLPELGKIVSWMGRSSTPMAPVQESFADVYGRDFAGHPHYCPSPPSLQEATQRAIRKLLRPDLCKHRKDYGVRFCVISAQPDETLPDAFNAKDDFYVKYELDDQDRVVISVQTREGYAVHPELEAPLAAETQSQRTLYSREDLTPTLRKLLILECQGTPYRNGGSSYFVPRQANERLARVERLVEGFGAGWALLPMGVLDEPAYRRSATVIAHEGLLSEMTDLKEQVQEQAGKDKTNAAALYRRLKDLSDMRAKCELYEDILGSRLEQVRVAIVEARQTVESALGI